jgi:hypothetical protein
MVVEVLHRDINVKRNKFNIFEPRFNSPEKTNVTMSDIGNIFDIEYFTSDVLESVPAVSGYITVRGVLTDFLDHKLGGCQTVYLDDEKCGVFHSYCDYQCRPVSSPPNPRE